MDNRSKQHWDVVYNSKAENEVSWFQPYPKTSMEFLELFNLSFSANIMDIGSGDSHFVDALLAKGYQNIWVLSISVHAIERAKKRLQEKASNVHWIVSHITEFKPPVQYDLWHDRAAFHFLTTEEQIGKYISLAGHAIKRTGYLILGTFSETGPDKCSRLDVKQYSETSMSARFEIAFDRIKCIHENHSTPFNTVQNFLFCSFKRK
jgi:cyclopropane fatty-acyl-phospholipid synthase-like methyltransferase